MQGLEELSRTKIEVIAARLFSARDWINNYGIPAYHLRDKSLVRKSYVEQRLPEEWETFLFGHRYYVFLSEDKIVNPSENIRRIKLNPSQIKLILETDFSIKGVQRNLAKSLSCSESYLSRIRRGLRRTNYTGARKISAEEKQNLFLRRTEVHTFFDTMFTVRQFFEKHADQYGIGSLQEIYDMSANRKYFSFPPCWHSIRVGNSWLVYYQKII